jgi:hypothetical protein
VSTKDLCQRPFWQLEGRRISGILTGSIQGQSTASNIQKVKLDPSCGIEDIGGDEGCENANNDDLEAAGCFFHDDEYTDWVDIFV